MTVNHTPPVKLTAKQEGFSHSIVDDDLNQSDAYRLWYDCGNMLPATINANASRLASSSKVSARITELRGVIQARLDVTQDEILGELRGIAFANVEDLMSWGPDGVKLRSSSDLSRAQTALVAEVQQTTTKDGGSIRLKVHDKLAALREINKMQGNYAEAAAPAIDTALDAILKVASALSDAQLRGLAQGRAETAIEGMFEVIPEDEPASVD